MDMLLNIFKDLADRMGLRTYYGTKSYDYLYTVEQENNTEPILFISPIVKNSDYNQHGGLSETFDIQISFLKKSDLDEDYDSEKYESHIKEMAVLQSEYFGYLNVLTETVSIKVIEVINQFNNMDGVTAEGTVTMQPNDISCMPLGVEYDGTLYSCVDKVTFTIPRDVESDFELGDRVIVEDVEYTILDITVTFATELLLIYDEFAVCKNPVIKQTKLYKI